VIRKTSLLPLPVLAFNLGYTVSPSLGPIIRSEVFAVSLGGWSGTNTDDNPGLEYRVLDNVAAGFASDSNAIRVTEESGNTRFRFENRLTGLHAFATGHF